MGLFKKLKKKLKKITFKDVANKMLGGEDSVMAIAKNLPAPIGMIAGAVSEGDKIISKLKGGKKKKDKTNVGDAVALATQVESQSAPTIAVGRTPREISREQRRMLRMKKRQAKKSARYDGYSKYSA